MTNWLQIKDQMECTAFAFDTVYQHGPTCRRHGIEADEQLGLGFAASAVEACHDFGHW